MCKNSIVKILWLPEFNRNTQFNLHIRFFPPSIVSLTLKLSDISIDNIDPSELIDCQRLDYLRPISDITQWTIGLRDT